MEEKQLDIFNQIFESIDDVLGNEESTGLEILGAILAMPDEQYETIKPVLFDNIEHAFDTPEAHIAFAQMMNVNGLKIEDFTENVDQLVDAVDGFTPEDVVLSDSKKDFLKHIFGAFVNAMNASTAVPRRVIQIPIQLCRDNAKLPTYATDGSAAMDIYSPEEYVIGPGESMVIPTGLKVDIPKGYALLIQPRSGLSRKTKLRIPNTPGLIDSDYHEEIGVIIENIDPPIKDAQLGEVPDHDHFDVVPLYGSSFTIGKGERFAQMRLVEVPVVNWLPVSDLGAFENDHGSGFGSTGTN